MVSSSTHSALAIPIAGRAREIAEIEASVDAIVAGECRVVLLSGEPGIGKSRMLHHAATYAESHGMLVLRGHCYDDAEMTPFAPFIEVMRDLVHQQPVVRDDMLVGPAHTALASLVPDIGLSTMQDASFSEAEHRQALHDAYGSLLASIGSRQPVVVLLDDLHWADEPSAQLLRRLVRSLRHAPVAILCAYRDTDLEQDDPFERVLIDLAREHIARRITLRRLESDATVSIVAQVLNVDPNRIAPQAVESIQRESEGVPFFIEELTLHLREEELLSPDQAGVWQLRREAGSFVPQSIRGVISRRLARLTDLARDVLALASVSGREFGLRVVCDVAASRGIASHAEVEAALDEAVSRRLLVRRDWAYVVVHEQIREVLYQSLSTIRRRQLHQLTAEAIERIHGSGPDIAARLAYHYSHGDDLERALHFTELAGDAAARIHATSDATRYYTEALEMLELLELPVTDQRRFRILLARDAVLAADGDHERRVAGVSTMLRLSETLGETEQIQSLDRASALALAREDFDEALECARRSRTRAEGARDEDRLTALLTLGQALARRPIGEPSPLYREPAMLREAIDTYSQALALAQSIGSVVDVARIRQEIGVLEWALVELTGEGDLERARESLLAALESFRAAGDRKGEVTSLIALAYRRRVSSSGEETDPRDSYVSFLEEIRRLRATEHRLVRQSERQRMEALALLSIALYCRTNGWYEVALQRGTQALNLAEAARDSRLAVMSLVGLSEVERLLGRMPRAIEHAERALVAIEANPRTPASALHQRDGAVQALAAAMAHAGNGERVMHLMQELVDQVEDVGSPARLAEALCWLAEISEIAGEADRADRTARRVLQIASTLSGGIAWDIRAELVLARLALSAGSHDLALGHASVAGGRLSQRDLPLISLRIQVERERSRALDVTGFAEDAATALTRAQQLVTRIAERIVDDELRTAFLTRSPLAVDVLPASEPPALSKTQGSSGPTDLLTRREIEVLCQVAAGLPNKEIADQLFISEKTVARHLTNIFTKLDVESRTQAAAWAFRQGIA